MSRLRKNMIHLRIVKTTPISVITNEAKITKFKCLQIIRILLIEAHLEIPWLLGMLLEKIGQLQATAGINKMFNISLHGIKILKICLGSATTPSRMAASWKNSVKSRIQ